MKRTRSASRIGVASVILAVVVSASNSAFPKDPGAGTKATVSGVTAKIQIGEHFLLKGTGMQPPGVPASSEDKADLLLSFALLFLDRGSTALGVGFDIEGNRIQVGPDRPGTGPQVFGLATFRLLALAEFRLRRGSAGRMAHTQPYAAVGAGWNINSVGAKVQYPIGSPPDGTALGLSVGNSPGARIGVGVHQRVTAQGLFLNLEAGWKWTTGSYRMTFANSPDISGDYDLSGLTVLFGVTLPLDAVKL